MNSSRNLASPPLWVLLPVKETKHAKQRLAQALNAAQRHALWRAMLEDVLDVVCAANSVAGVMVVSSDPVVRILETHYPITCLADPGQGGLNGAVDAGVARLRQLGAEAVMVVHGDIPLMTTEVLEELIEHHLNNGPTAHVTVVPDAEENGTNVLVATPADAISFHYGHNSFDAHRQACENKGLAVSVFRHPNLALDIDTPKDLEALLDAYVSTPGFDGRRTRKLLEDVGVGDSPLTCAATA